MLTIHAPTADDFASQGLGALLPSEALVEEEAGGMYELKLVQPISGDGRISIPAPTRDATAIPSNLFHPIRTNPPNNCPYCYPQSRIRGEKPGFLMPMCRRPRIPGAGNGAKPPENSCSPPLRTRETMMYSAAGDSLFRHGDPFRPEI